MLLILMLFVSLTDCPHLFSPSFSHARTHTHTEEKAQQTKLVEKAQKEVELAEAEKASLQKKIAELTSLKGDVSSLLKSEDVGEEAKENLKKILVGLESVQ